MGVQQNNIPNVGRDEVIRDISRPSPISGKCVCVTSPCNCTDFGIRVNARSTVNDQGFSDFLNETSKAVGSREPQPANPDKKNQEPRDEPSLVESAINEVGEIFDAVVQGGKKLIAGTGEAIGKPIAETGKGILDEARGFLGGINDTVRFGLVAIAIALLVAIVLGIVVVGRK